jgi:hypothetical protein
VLTKYVQAKKLVVYLDKERFGADFSNPLIKADVELALQPVLSSCGRLTLFYACSNCCAKNTSSLGLCRHHSPSPGQAHQLPSQGALVCF